MCRGSKVKRLRGVGPQEWRRGGFLICPAVHVRPLRGLSTLLALSPGRSRSWWLASRRPRARSTTWGYSWCDPSGVSAAPSCPWYDLRGQCRREARYCCRGGVYPRPNPAGYNGYCCRGGPPWPPSPRRVLFFICPLGLGRG